MNEYSLTPVQEVDGLRIKRDDLYAPFGPGEVNGGKLRQCVMLVNSVKKDYKSLLTYCSIHSPQEHPSPQRLPGQTGCRAESCTAEPPGRALRLCLCPGWR